MRFLLIAASIAKNGGVKFCLPGRQIELGAELTEKAWMILEHCNGVNTVDSVVEAVKGIDAAFVEGFLNDLQALGIVIDSRQYYKHFHAISSKPMVYSSDITNDEIAAHVASPRMAVKTSVGFTFKRDDSSSLRKLHSFDTREGSGNRDGERLRGGLAPKGGQAAERQAGSDQFRFRY